MTARDRVAINFEQHAHLIPSMTAGMNVYHSPHIVATNTGLNCDTVNIISIRSAHGFSGDDLRNQVDIFRKNDLNFCIWVEEQNLTPKVKDVLHQLNLHNDQKEPGMMFNEPHYEFQPSENENIRIVKTAEELHDFSKVLSANWEPPDQQLVVYYDRVRDSLLNMKSPSTLAVYYVDHKAAGCIEIFHPDEQTGGLYNLSTLKSMRGKGIGTALMSFSLQYLRRKGINNVVLQASEDGINIYRKLGFEVVCNFFEFK